MQLSCLPVSFFNDILAGRMSVAQWAAMGQAAGLDAIDLSILFIPDRSPATAARLRQEIEHLGMRVAMVTSYPDFTHPDAAQRERELELAVNTVRVAQAIGAQLLRVTAGQAHPETSRADGVSWAAAGLTQLVERTRGSGVTLVYENHAKPSPWTYTDFSQPPELFLEVVRRTANTGLGVNFDTANATAFADDPCALLRQVIDRVTSLHAADTALHGELKHVLLGTGLTPFAALFRQLRQHGFDGWVCMEEASMQGQAGVVAAAQFVRACWQTALAPVQLESESR
jgi:sugar phosphate isomerase/epimerase